MNELDEYYAQQRAKRRANKSLMVLAYPNLFRLPMTTDLLNEQFGKWKIQVNQGSDTELEHGNAIYYTGSGATAIMIALDRAREYHGDNVWIQNQTQIGFINRPNHGTRSAAVIRVIN